MTRFISEFIFLCLNNKGDRLSLVAQTVKNLPAVQETAVRSLGREDSLKRVMATHSSILAWRIPWTEEPARFIVHGVAKSRTN